MPARPRWRSGRFTADQRGLFNGGTLCLPFACVHRVDCDWSERGEARIHLAHRIQSLGVLEGQRLEEHGVDQRKDGGGRADPDGEREDGNRGKTRTAGGFREPHSGDPAPGCPTPANRADRDSFPLSTRSAELEPGAA